MAQDIVKSEDEKRKAALAELGLPPEPVEDNIESEDLSVPRVKLTQGSSQEVKDGLAKVGEFINSVDARSYGDKIEFIIAHYIRQRIKFADDGSGNFDCVSQDSKAGNTYGECSKCQFAKFEDADGEKKKPECNLIHGFLGMIVDGQELLEACILLGMTSTSTPTARKILTTQKLGRKKMNFWERAWKIGFAKREKGAYSWLAMTAQPSRILDPGNKQDAELMTMAYDIYKWAEGKKIIVEDVETTDVTDPNIEAPF